MDMEPAGREVENPSLRADLRASLGLWRRQPAVPLLTLFLALGSAVPAALSPTKTFHPVELPFDLVLMGWAGTQRVWYVRGFRSDHVETPELMSLTAAFFWRFVVLAILVSTVGSVFLLPLDLWQPRGFARALTVVGYTLMAVVADVLLTFVVPALALSTRHVIEAVRMGLRMLREEWPRCGWYALTPPLAAALVARVIPRSELGPGLAATLGTMSIMLGLWFKGAIVAYYLRVERVPRDGSAHS